MAMLETPSRIWRRIEAVEAETGDMPSLPSLPGFDDSAAEDADPSLSRARSVSLSLSHNSVSLPPVQSTPAISFATTRSTIRPQSSTSSTVRFANSIHTNRSGKSTFSGSGSGSREKTVRSALDESFNVPEISYHYEEDGDAEQEMVIDSGSGFPDVHFSTHHISQEELEGEGEQELSLTEALESISRTSSPRPDVHEIDNGTMRTPAQFKTYDYSVSLRAENSSTGRAFNHVSLRRATSGSRTPSLSRTSPSSSSASSNSTPRSARSIALPQSASPSPRHAEIRHSEEDTEHLEQSQYGSEPDITQEHSMVLEKEENGSDVEQEEHSPHDSGGEPTFSSEEAPSSNLQHSGETRSAPSFSAAFTSPAPSVAFTPTPTFQARSTARCDNNPLSQLQTDPISGNEDPTTPHARRKSFLLSVINSAARPRLAFPTPYAQPPLKSAYNAFAGATPGPRAAIQYRRGRRSSHPLAQAHTLDPSTPSTGSKGSGEGEMTPSGSSASFISTASSHDLTVHPRANASFDPVTGAQGGVGRFNAGKLNTYLHGLNRRLQEENEVLVERLQMQQEENARLRSKFSGGELSGVMEDAGAEGWLMDRDVLERQVEHMKAEIEAKEKDKEAIERDLDEERQERSRDKDRWKERMGEVEKGVGDIVRDLEKRLEEAEIRAQRAEEAEEKVMHMEAKLVQAEAQCQLIAERAEKAEHVMESERELGGELTKAHQSITKLSGDLQAASAQITVLEEERIDLSRRADAAETKLEVFQNQEKELRLEMQTAHEAVDASQDRIQELEQLHRNIADDLRAAKAYIAELEAHAGAAAEQIENLEEQLAKVKEQVEKLRVDCVDANERVQILNEEAGEANGLAKQMEEALEENERKMLADEDECIELKARIASLERSREHKRERTKSSSQITPERESESDVSDDVKVDVDALEAELDEANKEIGRLHALLLQSPARMAIEKAKDTRITMLEKEREDLLDRVHTARNTTIATPIRVANMSGMSPMHRHLLSMRAPKTPGEPLRDLSWLHNVTEDPSASPLLEEINRLQTELDKANESIDDKLEQLEEAGLGVVGLTKALEDARGRIALLEEQIAKLSRKDQRRIRRLERARCIKCRCKVDLRGLNGYADRDESSFEISTSSLPSNPPTPPSKTTEMLGAKLQSVNNHLESLKHEWDDDKRRLLGEKAILQDAAHRLNAEIGAARKEVKEAMKAEQVANQAKTGHEQELDKAKGVIIDLENELRTERSRLRSITAQQSRATREKGDIMVQLERAESDIDDVKGQLQQVKQKNVQLEAELQGNINTEQRAHLLEVELAENNRVIEQLREERSLLASERTELQRRFTVASDQVDELRRNHSASQTSHDNRRHQLDLYAGEIEELRSALSTQTNRLTVVQAEKSRIASERRDVQHSVAKLETDLRRVQRDAEIFGRDLKHLRVEKERLEEKHREELAHSTRVCKQNQTQIRLLNEQLAGQRDKAKRATDVFKTHVCAADDNTLEALKLQHNKECKGLIVQIRYLKAKFARESSLRADLGYQKHYLLLLLSKYKSSEQKVVASIARIGFPLPPNPTTRRKSLKTIGILVVFLARARRASDLWREQRSSRQAVADALQDVRRRRATGS